ACLQRARGADRRGRAVSLHRAAAVADDRRAGDELQLGLRRLQRAAPAPRAPRPAFEGTRCMTAPPADRYSTRGDLVLVLNCGSSSIKFALFDAGQDPLPRQPAWNGKVQGIGGPS